MPNFGEPISGSSILVDQHIVVGLIPLILALVGVLVHVAFAAALFIDASGRRRGMQIVWFVHPIIWAAAALIGGVFTAAIYWAMHYSTLASPRVE